MKLQSPTTQYTYHWYAITTDDNNLTSATPADDCYFTYNPTAPAAPSVTFPNGTQGALGTQIPVSFTAPAGVCPGSACPVSYTYQLGASTPTTVTATSGSWTGNITIPLVGPLTLTVAGIAAGGNPGEAALPTITGLPPQTPYADGDFTGDGQPDLLTLGTSSAPSLWLSPSNGAGTLGAATDIGGAGTGISPGTDGPGDWAGTKVLHGDFTGNHIQDVMAYYPSGTHAGTAVILAGTGNGTALRPFSGTSWMLTGALADPANGDYPTQLVAAGNASESNTGTSDLIGIAGDSVNGYTLDLFTSTVGGGPTEYGLVSQTLSAQSPDAGPSTPSDWQNFQLATAQPGGNPSATVLFALNTLTGALYESTNPSQSASSIIGMGNWQQITPVPWGASPPTLLSADMNTAQTPQIELWTRSGTAITAYTLNGTTLSTEHAGALSQPLDEWPLAEGSGSTTADTISGQTATLAGAAGGATWKTDGFSQFGNYITLDGVSGYVTPPAGTIPASATTPKISLWFRTSTPGGILASLDGDPLSHGTSTTSTYDPVLYIGTDGHLYGEWWNGSAKTPAVSASPVDDGFWHHATLTSTGSAQTLYVDNQPGVVLNGTVNISGQGSNLSFGGGYIGYNWPSEPHYQQNGGTGYSDYFTGQIADVTYNYPGGP